ncbi:gamma-glutamyltransferase [Sediminimonas sp.]|uniref:gamma-glutamyltransferase n=1 Tax=Sediminimonas sp. TaxID=2823379 RepID=UPI0025D67CC3|nr:gamma-glutamyltransferase [Sediminimonas sp.]
MTCGGWIGAVLAALVSLTGIPVAAQQAADAHSPEAGGAGALAISPGVAAALDAKADGRPVAARDWMLSVANPHAARAGARVLSSGGTAADAMVAVQAMLGLVEPQSSGLGGGAFLLWYDAQSGTLSTLDGRETAPMAATPRLFLGTDGTPLGFFEAVVGGLSVGTPGVPALMQAAHDRWGRLPWAGLFADAADLAERGFVVSPRLAGLVARDTDRLSVHPETAAYFLPGGAPLAAGDRLRNPAYARLLRVVARQGAGAVYSGPVAGDIVAAVRGAARPGLLSRRDLEIYKVKQRAPVCAPYRGHRVCGMGPPSSGGLTVAQTLRLLEGYDLAAMGPRSPRAWRLIGDASRLAFADRGLYMADSDFVPVPVKGLLAPDYIARRARLLTGEVALAEVAPGRPAFDHAGRRGPGETLTQPATSHISIVDSYGNALSMTSSIENAFGSRVMVRGMLLNNQLTDFSFRSHRDGRPIANAVAPGKRPRSSMAPTIVLRDGAPVLVLGSPGGSRIIGYVAQALIAHLDWGMNVQQAAAMGHLVNRFGAFDVERGTGAEALSGALTDLGYEVARRAMTSGLHMVAITPEGLRGGADPRREGVALGE